MSESPLSQAAGQLESSSSGGGILDTIRGDIASLADRASSLVSGGTVADVQSGALNPQDLSREDRAALFIDGEVPGVLERNPWHVGLDLSPAAADFSHAHGGAVFVISCTASTLDTLDSKVFTPRFAFLWDDEVLAAEAGTLNLDVTTKTFLVVLVKDQPLAQRLTLFCTDQDIVFTVIQQGAPSELDSIRKTVFGAVGAAAGDPLAQFFATIQGFFDVQKVGLVALAVVGGVVAYMLLKSEAGRDALRAAAGGG